MTLRGAGCMNHLGTGAAHARKRVLALADNHHITVADLTTGEVLSTHLIEPNKTYWRNQNREPGRWQNSQNRDPCRDSPGTYVPTHHSSGEGGIRTLVEAVRISV